MEMVFTGGGVNRPWRFSGGDRTPAKQSELSTYLQPEVSYLTTLSQALSRGARMIEFAWSSDAIIRNQRIVNDRLDYLTNLPADWDSYGSPPLHEDAVTGARYLIDIAPSSITSPPFIGPVTGGGVYLAWEIANRELEMYVYPDGSVEWVTEEGDDVDGGKVVDYTNPVLATEFEWLTQG